MIGDGDPPGPLEACPEFDGCPEACRASAMIPPMPEGIRVVMTCCAFPEQYDVFFDDRQIGYLRLRASWWSVSYPDAQGGRFGGGEDLFGVPYGTGHNCGNFEDEDRANYLTAAVEMLIRHHLTGNVDVDASTLYRPQPHRRDWMMRL